VLYLYDIYLSVLCLCISYVAYVFVGLLVSETEYIRKSQ
jgi:hypothetical protein